MTRIASSLRSSQRRLKPIFEGGTQLKMNGIIVFFILLPLILAMACTPKAAPVQPPATAVPMVTPAAPIPTTPARTPEDVAWAKIVEAGRKEGKLTFYASAYLGDTGVAVRNAFKNKYDIDMEIITGPGAAFIERLKTEKRMGSMVGDVVQPATSFAMTMKNQDLLELVSPELPSPRNRNDFRVGPFLDKEGYILISTVVQNGPAANTKLVKPEDEPKSWQDMLNPKWKGKLVAGTPVTTLGLYVPLVTLLNAKAITLEMIRDMGKQDVAFTTSAAQTAERLARGDYPMALQLAVNQANSFIEQGAPIKVLPMAEGNAVTSGVVAQVKGGPHPNAARLFLDWTISAEGQAIYHKANRTTGVRKDVPDYQPQALRLPPTAKIMVETLNDIDDEAQKFADKWLIELWKKQ